MIYKLKSDGSGGFSGISNTIGLGNRKHIAYCSFHILVLFIFSTALQTNDSHVCLFLTLILQRSNEMYKTIKHPYRRVLCSTKNNLICYHFTTSLLVSTLSLWVTCLILLCGDVQSNPGPDSVEGSIVSVSSCSSSSFEYLSKLLSIMHLNIQSIVPKLDLMEGEASAYDVLVFSESWLNPRIPNASICIEHFSPPFRADRLDRPSGGVIVYVRDTLPSKHRTDLEIPGLEAV